MQVLEDTFEVGKLVRERETRSWFEGHDRQTDQPVSIQLFRGAEPRLIYRRFQEASFLSHPNLLRICRVLLHEEGVYVVSERGEYDLPQFVEQRPMPPDDARELTLQLIPGLRALHDEDLVLCNLELNGVWKIGQQWKLADFSELRLAGSADGEMRRILARLPSAPPEAFEGRILPAWDVWSLGALLQKVLTPSPAHVEGSVSLPRGRHIRLHGLPEPFDTIARDCLQPDPAARPSLDGIEQQLVMEPPPSPPSLMEELGVATPHEEAAPALQHLPFREDRSPSHRRVWLALILGILLVILVGSLLALRERRKTEIPADREAERMRTNGAPVATFGTPEKPTEKGKPGSGERIPEAPSGDSVEALLNHWVQATREKNAAAVASFYAPRVRTFYGRRNLTREQLRQERVRIFNQIGPVRKLEISNLQVTQLGPNSAVALFDKTWDFGQRYAGSAREQLSFGKYGGGWKITAERELKVYTSKRP